MTDKTVCSVDNEKLANNVVTAQPKNESKKSQNGDSLKMTTAQCDPQNSEDTPDDDLKSQENCNLIVKGPLNGEIIQPLSANEEYAEYIAQKKDKRDNTNESYSCLVCLNTWCEIMSECWIAFVLCCEGGCTECLSATCMGCVECLEGCGEGCLACTECCGAMS